MIKICSVVGYKQVLFRVHVSLLFFCFQKKMLDNELNELFLILHIECNYYITIVITQFCNLDWTGFVHYCPPYKNEEHENPVRIAAISGRVQTSDSRLF